MTRTGAGVSGYFHKINIELVHERELRLCGGLIDAGDDRAANGRFDRVRMA